MCCGKVFGVDFTKSLTLLRNYHWVGTLVLMYLVFKSLSPNKPTLEHLQSPSG